MSQDDLTMADLLDQQRDLAMALVAAANDKTLQLVHADLSTRTEPNVLEAILLVMIPEECAARGITL